MAVLDEFEVKVWVNGEVAQEYEDDEDEQLDPTQIVKYVEVISGAFFEIRITITPGYHVETGQGVSGEVFLDGRYQAGVVFSQAHLSAGKTRTVSGRRGLGPGGHGFAIARFKFADLQTRMFARSSSTQG
jgi:hypothetical protein